MMINKMIVGIITAGIVIAAGIWYKKNQSQTRIEKKETTYNKKAEEFVKRLDALGYFKYADDSDIVSLKENMIDNFDPDNELVTIWDDHTGTPKDFRYYFCDGETVYEEGGITGLLQDLQPTFQKLGFNCETTNHFEEWDDKNKWLNHSITINGTPYVIFKNFTGTGWGEAPKRIAEILNMELSKQGKDEKIYLVSGGNDGRLLFLTEGLYQHIYSVYKNPQWKPLELEEWGKVMGVQPMALH